MNTAANSGAMELQPHKVHRTGQSGSWAKRKPKSDINKQDNKKPNTKSFGFNSSVKSKGSQMRTTKKEQRWLHIPTIDRSYGGPPLYVVVVQGPPQVGKSLLMKCLLKHYTKHKVPEVRGPVTVVSEVPFFDWRTCCPYVVVDRFEDVTPPERVHMNNKCDRNITIYGYLRGCNQGTKSCNLHGMLVSMTALKVHIAGVGDYSLAGVTGLADPWPLPSAAKKKGLCDKEKLFYAPMSGLGDLLYDTDAVYINIIDHFVQFSNMDDENGKLNCRGKAQDVGEMLVKLFQNPKYSIDEKLEKSFISVFSCKPNISSDATNNAKIWMMILYS
ncbi:hypothetical protein WN944_027442 [Citrus x changshan-huyou]|uniref:AARP2CN domain-containing protein n=1 Tax=Citrus x changshan-huyou TaxID=2935761 RepID=A0AAP0LKU7_9ROSI